MAQSFYQKEGDRTQSRAAAHSIESSEKLSSQLRLLAPPPIQLQASSQSAVIQRNITGSFTDSMNSWVNWGGDVVRSGGSAMADNINYAGSMISSGVDKVGNMAASGISTAGAALESGAKTAGSYAKLGGQVLGAVIQEGGSDLAEKARELGPDVVGDWVESGSKALGSGVGSAGKQVEKHTKSAGKTVRKAANKTGRAVRKGSQQTQKVVNSASSATADFTEGSGEFLAEIGERFHAVDLGTDLEALRSIEAGVRGMFEKEENAEGEMETGGAAALALSLGDALLDWTVGRLDASASPRGKEMKAKDIDSQARIDEIFAHDMAYWSNMDGTKAQELESLGYDPTSVQPVWGKRHFSMVSIKPLDNSGKKPIISFTGTNTALEEHLGTNTDPMQVGHSQYYLNQKKIDAVFKEMGGDVIVVGHSLGGALAQIAAAEHTDQVSRLTTFQAPGIHQKTKEKYLEGLAKRTEQGKDAPIVNHHAVKNDIVSLAGQVNLPGSYYLHDKGDEDSLDAHTHRIFDGKNHDVRYFKDATDHPYKFRRMAAETLRSGIGMGKELLFNTPQTSYVPQDKGFKSEGNGWIKPYAYENHNKTESGRALGKEGAASTGGYSKGNSNMEFFKVRYNKGETDDEAGGTKYGHGAGLSVAEGKVDIPDFVKNLLGMEAIPKEFIMEAQGSALSLSGDAYVNPEKGMYAGVGANAVEGSFSSGTQNSGNRDRQTTIGLGIGEGMGAGLYWGDDDKDNLPEYGFELDLPVMPFSVKATSEDPLRDFLYNPLSMVGSGPTSYLSSMILGPDYGLAPPEILPDKNLTQEAKDQISNLMKMSKGSLEGMEYPQFNQRKHVIPIAERKRNRYLEE